MTSTGNHFFNQLKSFVYGIEQDIQHYSDEESLSSLESEKCLIKLKENIKAMQNQYNDLENSVFGKPECRLSHVSIDEVGFSFSLFKIPNIICLFFCSLIPTSIECYLQMM